MALGSNGTETAVKQKLHQIARTRATWCTKRASAGIRPSFTFLGDGLIGPISAHPLEKVKVFRPENALVAQGVGRSKDIEVVQNFVNPGEDSNQPAYDIGDF